MPTHKKAHDKDKYYHLAKDQGYRARSAFKLIQINKRFDFLGKARVLIDLCAAPGGWCQVAAKFMPVGSIILGIDLMPIRDIRNVKTIVADITTAECRKLVAKELQGWKADVVLCDGAPNIGSAYSKDAYVQNELVLASLKTACEHLIQGGTFCTKVYRSTDYNSLIWVFQQLFEDVQSIKPTSSRQASSEIFIVCLKYIAPAKIDPKLLDPNHVFKEVADPGLATVDVLHKKYDKLNKRKRGGYDEALGITLRNKVPVSSFVQSKDPVRILTDANELTFTPSCEQYLNHADSNEEIKRNFADLRILGKIDFKKILKWRQKMRTEFKLTDVAVDEIEEAKQAKIDAEKAKRDERFSGKNLTEDDILEELELLREKSMHEDRKLTKKKRQLAAKERERQNLGMSSAAFGVDEDLELFSINANTRLDQMDDFNDVNLESMTAEEYDQFMADEKKEETNKGAIVYLEDNLEDDLEIAYSRFVKGKKAKEMGISSENARTHTAKKLRAGKTSDGILKNNADGDEELESDSDNYVKPQSENVRAGVEGDLSNYIDLLKHGSKKTTLRVKKGGNKGEESQLAEDEDDSDSSDDSDDEEIDYTANDYAVSHDRLTAGKRIDKWFSNPIFKETLIDRNDDEADIKRMKEQQENARKLKNEKDNKNKRKELIVDPKERFHADEGILSMPLTDKQQRQEKRKKAVDRADRRKNRKDVRDGKDNEDHNLLGFDVVYKEKETDEDGLVKLDEATRQKRELIKQGMGKQGRLAEEIRQKGNQGVDKDSKFEVVAAEIDMNSDDEALLPRKDDRDYDSDAEDYDAHDRAMTLALGTLMLRKSKQKSLVDASYNRFSWNDAKDLPSWFLDDESRHNKPQLPVPAALLEQIKQKYQATGTREIKKVAEARMRKKKRATNALKAAKKQANALADNNEMSDKQKIKAISKAMKGSKADKPSKVYVVTKKTGGASSGTATGNGKGKLKFVDKRMKKEARAERVAKKQGKAWATPGKRKGSGSKGKK